MAPARPRRRPGGLASLWRASLRQMLRRPGQVSLAVVGVMLGVAVVVAVDLASDSAGRAFELSTEAVTGRTTHEIVGGPEGLAEGLFPRLVGAGIAAAPVIEDWVTVVGTGATEARRTTKAASAAGSPAAAERALHLLGVDPFSEGPFRPYLAIGGAGDGGGGGGGAAAGGWPAVDLSALLLRPGTCLLAAGTAAELGLRRGDRFAVRVAGRVRWLELAGVLHPGGEAARRALADLVLMDIAAAQELVGRQGKLDRIDLRLPTGVEGRQTATGLASVEALLPAGAQLLEAAGRTRATLDMTRAFRINLTALSLLALLCGAFLIYNTMTFSVLQRRALLGTLRTLGVTRGQVLTLVLGEAAVLAVIGTAGGLAAGVLLGRGLLRLVTQTINDLYFVVAVRDLAVTPGSLWKGAAIGIGATLLATLAPAIEAAFTPPRAVLSRSLLEARLRRALPRATGLGCGLLVLGGGLLGVPARLTGEPLVLGFGGLFLVIVGFALLAPAATVGLMRLARPLLGALLGIRGRMAAGGVVASLSRTAVAIAALMVAVSVTVGVGVMIDSFRQTVVRWLDLSLQSDIYVSAVSRGGGFRGARLAPELAARAARLPGVAAVHTLRRAELPTPRGPIRLLAIDTDRRGFGAFELLEGDAEGAWRQVAQGSEAMVSEPFSRRYDVHAGGAVVLPTSVGMQTFRVAGVYADYASDRGLVLISHRTFLRFWHDPWLSGFSVDLAAGGGAPAGGAGGESDGGGGKDPGGGAGLGADEAVDRTVERLRSTLGSEVPLSIQGNRALKRLSLDIFDRTFLITGVLRLLAGLVAAIGVLAALTALQLERAREIGVLRATGLTPGQVWQLITTQTGLIGLAAGLMSLPVGLVLSAIMVYIINRRSFGWTVRLEISPRVLVEALLLAVLAALAAGVYPAYRMARILPALALREE